MYFFSLGHVKLTKYDSTYNVNVQLDSRELGLTVYKRKLICCCQVTNVLPFAVFPSFHIFSTEYYILFFAAFILLKEAVPVFTYLCHQLCCHVCMLPPCISFLSLLPISPSLLPTIFVHNISMRKSKQVTFGLWYTNLWYFATWWHDISHVRLLSFSTAFFGLQLSWHAYIIAHAQLVPTSIFLLTQAGFPKKDSIYNYHDVQSDSQEHNPITKWRKSA